MEGTFIARWASDCLEANMTGRRASFAILAVVNLLAACIPTVGPVHLVTLGLREFRRFDAAIDQSLGFGSPCPLCLPTGCNTQHERGHECHEQ